jgi:hypothetical protein
MTYIETLQEAEELAIRGAYERLQQDERFQKRGAMARLYMMCLELDLTHVRLQPKLKRLGIDLSDGAPEPDFGIGRAPKLSKGYTAAPKHRRKRTKKGG